MEKCFPAAKFNATKKLRPKMSCGENFGDEIPGGEIGRGANIIRRNLTRRKCHASKFPAAKFSAVKYPVAKFNTAKNPVLQKH